MIHLDVRRGSVYRGRQMYDVLFIRKRERSFGYRDKDLLSFYLFYIFIETELHEQQNNSSFFDQSSTRLQCTSVSEYKWVWLL